MDTAGKLPDDTKIFCGHEYTMKNLEFAALADPKNSHIDSMIKETAEKLAANQFTVPSILKDEKLYNVFMKCRDPDF